MDQNLKGFSVPGFLRKVFNKELGYINGCDHKLVVIAVHAVLKDSGFLCFDTVSKTKTDGFYLQNGWCLPGLNLSLCYTLPEIVQTSDVVKTVTLKILSSKKYIFFYGSLSVKGSAEYWVRFDVKPLANALNLTWANLDNTFERKGSAKELVSEFWRIVKEKLVLSLLIDLRKIANLLPLSCFSDLPDEIKLAILELLPAADVARAGRVSRDLRVLSFSDDLWKKKFFKEFGNADVAEGFAGEGCWKKKFSKSCEARKMMRLSEMEYRLALWCPNYRGGKKYIEPFPIRGGKKFGYAPAIQNFGEKVRYTPY